MTWRQILEGLALLATELRELRRDGTVSVLSVKDSDVIVVETERVLSHDSRERISGMCKKLWPNNRVTVWDSGLRLRVMSGGREGEA